MRNFMVDNSKIKVLISKEQLLNKVKDLGQEITKDYKEKNPLIISILRGGVIF